MDARVLHRSIALVACLWCSTALAQQADPAARSAAVAAFDSAEQLMALHKYAEACPKYAESYRLDPQLGALLLLADCQEKNGQFASAYASFREAVELAKLKSDKRAADATECARALEPRLNHLTVEVASAARIPNLQVTRDGLVLAEGSWGLAMPIDPGEHVIEARAKGYVPFRKVITLTGEGRQERIEIPALIVETQGVEYKPLGGTASATTVGTAPRDPGKTQRLVGWLAGSAGLVGLGAGLVFDLRKSSTIDDRNKICPSGTDCDAGTQARIDGMTDDAKAARTASLISFVAGGVALGAGAALLLTAPRSHTTPARGMLVVPVLDAKYAGLFATRSF